jgi:hypothetical protein
MLILHFLKMSFDMIPKRLIVEISGQNKTQELQYIALGEIEYGQFPVVNTGDASGSNQYISWIEIVMNNSFLIHNRFTFKMKG